MKTEGLILGTGGLRTAVEHFLRYINVRYMFLWFAIVMISLSFYAFQRGIRLLLWRLLFCECL